MPIFQAGADVGTGLGGVTGWPICERSRQLADRLLIRSTRWARPESAAPGTGQKKGTPPAARSVASHPNRRHRSWRQSTQNRRERHSQIRRSGQARPGTVRCSLWAGPILQGCPSVAGVVRRHDSSIGCNNAERHSTVCHLVKARPMRCGSPSGPTLRTTPTDDA